MSLKYSSRRPSIVKRNTLGKAMLTITCFFEKVKYFLKKTMFNPPSLRLRRGKLKGKDWDGMGKYGRTWEGELATPEL